ncbi:cell wall-binding protein [Methylobacterium sp. SyP6R]|uniref:cell wall-binding protein n=1 Tax=Methylobacterium sp. SyP6R TaxID=2718876 RepID=UPI001F19F1A5|nr:cell wall-binding protein [Methylobacterium sp. SyP6R]MCF4129477.1 cell wall-binding protein [Methylobacterium sp. SyP6R]
MTGGGAGPMPLRARYEAAVADLRERVAALRRDGLPAEAIARAVHAERLRLAAHFKALTPEPYRTRIVERTVRVYGNALGPSIDFLRVRGKSWEAIIESATRPGPPVGLDPEPGDAAAGPAPARDSEA